MLTKLDIIRREMESQGINPQSSSGHAWLLMKMKHLSPTGADLFKDRQALMGKAILGRFYFFYYHAKHRDKLPYWDRFPLVIPIEQYRDGFLGLNIHYIHPKDRMLLLKKLREFATGPVNDEQTRVRLSYPLLRSTRNLFELTPCIKRYLWTNVITRFLEIPSNEWDIAAALPVQDFRQITSSTGPEKVWSDSRSKY